MDTAQPGLSPISVGIEIRAARRSAGLKQQGLAQLIGVSRNTVSNWERGIGEPTITEWRAIAAATHCDWLLSKGVDLVTKYDAAGNLRDVSELRLFNWSEAS